MTGIKICGVRDATILAAAQKAEAHFVGFVFVPSSPRFIGFAAAAILAPQTGLQKVGLFVDPSDDDIRQTLSAVPLDMIQLHGDESPKRVADIRAAFNRPVMKAIRLAGPEDLNPVPDYEQVSDWLLFDTKTEGIAGGSGRAFDWHILKGKKFSKPWMLAGGLTPDNVTDALALLRPDAVDVSSGVESAPGVKDACKIEAFAGKVRAC